MIINYLTSVVGPGRQVVEVLLVVNRAAMAEGSNQVDAVVGEVGRITSH